MAEPGVTPWAISVVAVATPAAQVSAVNWLAGNRLPSAKAFCVGAGVGSTA